MKFHVVVVDNDPSGSAETTTKEFASLVTYVHEPKPGIAAARNAGIEAAAVFQPRALVFIDDDEVAPPHWLSQLVSTWKETSADVVTGPVRFELPDGFEHLANAVPHFYTPDRADHSPVEDVATGNTLVDATWFHGSAALRFSEQYSLTGGSDIELFNRLRRQGGRCVWAAKASVVETVPRARTTPQWMRQRDLRNGQLRARLMLESNSRATLRLAVEGVLRVLKGAFVITLSRPETSSNIQGWRTLQTGRGYLKAVSGRHFNEYALGRNLGRQYPGEGI